jgi:endonuclease/exonuclease/phosphatase family metal-dependent hydrolase
MANMRDIVFATVNLYNLQLPGRAMYPKSRLYEQAEYDAKIAWLAQALARLDADVVGFQELWSPQPLRDVLARPVLGGRYAPAFIMDRDWDGIAVAAAVRAPWEIAEVERIKAFPPQMRLRKRRRTMRDIQQDPPEADAALAESLEGAEALEGEPEFVPSHEDDEIKVKIDAFSRSALRVRVVHGQAKRPTPPPLDVFVAHLKSKLSTPLDNAEWRDEAVRVHQSALGAALSAIRRTAEATALRIVMTEAMRGNDTPAVLLGDLNDGQFSDVLAILTGQPSFRVYDRSTAGRRSDTGLYTGATLQQLRSLRDVLYTHEHRNVREIIDHVLVSEQFYDFSDMRLWSFRELTVLNDHVDGPERATSDHGLVRARFHWAPARGAMA